MSPEEEGKLIAILSEIDRKVSLGNSNLDLLRHEQMRTMAAVGLLHNDVRDVRARLERHGKRLRSLEDAVNKPAPDSETTGRHHVLDEQAIMRHRLDSLVEVQAERRQDSIWWKRQTRLWVVAVAGAVAMALLTGAGSLIFWLLTRR